MKIKILVLIAACSLLLFPHAEAQKTLKKMSSDACDCVTDLAEEMDALEANDMLDKCLQLTFSKYEKKLRKEYGDEFFDSPSDERTYDLGVEIGKLMLTDCPVFLDFIVAQEESSDKSAADIYAKGDELYDAGNFKEVVLQYNRAIKIDPENHDYYNSRGVAYFEQGKYYYAISDFINAIRFKSNYSRAYYNLAYSKYNLEDYGSALDDAETSLLYDPDYCSAYNLVGLIYNRKDEKDSAFNAFESARNCDTVASLYPFNMGYMRYIAQQYEGAIEYFNEAIEKGYTDISIYKYLGNSLDVVGKYEQAIEAHSKYINENPEDYVGLYNRGLVYYHMKNYSEAINNFEQSALLDDTDPDIFLKLAQCHEGLGQNERAESYFSKAIELNPENAEYFDARATFYAEIKDYEKAIEDSKMSLHLYPDDCNVYMSLSMWYQAMGDESNARSARQTGLDMGCEE